MLYGLFVIGAVCLAAAGELFSFLALLTLITLKFGTSWFGDSDAITQNMIAANIVEEAHLYGAIAGGITAAGWLPYTLWFGKQKQDQDTDRC